MKIKFRATVWHCKDGPPVPGVIIQSDRKQFFIEAADLYRVADTLVDMAEKHEKETP